jgi:gas vesicle protein
LNENNNGKLIAWFLGGAALGAVVALVLAPAAGEDTRRQLARQAQRGRKVLSESGQDFLDRGRDLYERGREVAEEAAQMFERGRQLAEKKFDEAV